MSATVSCATHARHLYAHIPFCPAKCEYCAFVTHIGSLKLAEPYVDALCAEASLRSQQHDGIGLETVYFGGGTPSLLTPAQIDRILRHVDRTFGIAENCEITMECHPVTVTRESLAGFRAAGVTRVSFGAESLHDDELKALGRQHVSADVLSVVDMARTSGFSSVALDFIYGIPVQSVESWGRTLETALDAGVDHLSLYPLSVEPQTVFARRARRHQLILPEDDTVVEMYGLACSLLDAAGFERYEIANWARPSHRCRHNTAYWRNAEFYAVGAGAHGYVYPYRTENLRQTKRYIDTVRHGGDPVTHREPIDEDIRAEETMMLGLRLLQDGPDLARVHREWGRHPLEVFADEISQLEEAGLIRTEGERIVLNEEAVPLANEVWERFILA